MLQYNGSVQAAIHISQLMLTGCGRQLRKPSMEGMLHLVKGVKYYRTFAFFADDTFFEFRLDQECQPFLMDPPNQALFDPKKVVVVTNGRYFQPWSEVLYSDQ